MLKTSVRFLVILLVTCLMGAGVYWVVKSNPTAFGPGDFRGGMEGQGRPGGNSEGFAPGGNTTENNPPEGFQSGVPQGQGNRPNRGFERGPGEGHGREGGLGSGRWIFGMVKNLAIIALITLLVGLFQKVISLFTRKRTTRVA